MLSDDEDDFSRLNSMNNLKFLVICIQQKPKANLIRKELK